MLCQGDTSDPPDSGDGSGWSGRRYGLPPTNFSISTEQLDRRRERKEKKQGLCGRSGEREEEASSGRQSQEAY